MSELKTSGNKRTKILLDWLYQNSTVKLNRKYQRYLELCELINSSNVT